MCRLRELNPHKNEIVRVKFKSIDQIVKDYNMDLHEAEDLFEIGDNIKAYLNGGDFIVANAIKKEDNHEYIVVKNHYDRNSEFYIYDEVIESIDIVQDAERFYSADHHLLVVRIEDEMYINGQPLIWDEDAARKTHDFKVKQGRRSGEYINENRKLLKIFENYIADLAVKESFKEGEL